MPQRHIKVGNVEGTGAAINVQTGFKPKKVVLYNIDDAGGLDPILMWTDGMGAGKGMKFLQITDSDTTGNKSHDFIASDGITQYVGTSGGDSQGFTIGADGDINVSDETIVWEAYR